MKLSILNSKIIPLYLSVIIASIFIVLTTNLAIGQITLNKTVVQQSTTCNQFDVQLKVTGNSTPAPIDVILVIDISGSMSSGSPSSMSYAKTAALNFVRKIFNPTNNAGNINRVGIVSFSTYGTEDIQLSYASDSTIILNKIINMVPNGSTNIADAFYQANKEMKSRGRTDCNVLRSILLLTDGVANMGSTYSAAGDRYDGSCTSTPIVANACTNSASLRGQESQSFTIGTVTYPNKVYTVGLFGGISGATQTVAENTLNAAQNSGYFVTESAADLNGIYTQIFGQLQWAAKAIPGSPMISDTIANGFTFIPGSLVVSKESASINGQIITWPLTFINNEIVTLNYSIVALNSNVCGINKAGNSWINYQNAACTIVKNKFPNPDICVPCPKIAQLSISQSGCTNIIQYSGTIISDEATCNIGQHFYSWAFTINNVLVGTATGINGTFTIPPQYASAICNGSIKGVLSYNSGSGCTLVLGEYTYSNLKIVTNAPTISANGSSSVQCLTDAITPTPPVVTDFCGTSIVPILTSTINNPVNITCSGTKTFTYTYTNCAGLNSVWKYVYTINDNIAPSFTRPADKTIYAGANCLYDASITATGDVTNESDNCSSNLQATYTDVISAGLGQVVYVIHRTWSLIDNCNNAASNQIQTITVLDIIPPVIVAPENIISCTSILTLNNPVSTDNCGIASITNNAPISFPLGITTIVTWTVTDIHGNSSTATQSVTVSNITTSINGSSQVSCHDNNDATITASANGGSGAYSYSLNGGTYQNSNIFTGISAGNYIITIKDENSCFATTSEVTITNPTLLTVSAIGSSQVSCNNSSDGLITVTAAGGTGAYSYSLNGGIAQSSNVFSGQASGSYIITVYDQNGCFTNTQSIVIANPSIISASAVGSSQVSCNNANDGSITVSAEGGTGAYSYSLNGGIAQSSNVFPGQASGSYVITVYDQNGCFANTQSVVIANPSTILASAVLTSPISCYNGNNGELTANAQGGTGSYSYSLNGNSNQPNNIFTGLVAGSYSIIITDEFGCTSTTNQIQINSPDSITISAIQSNLVCFGTHEAIVEISATGGTPSYQYSIDGGVTYQTSTTFDSLSVGILTIYVMDANNCTSQAYIFKTVETAEILANINILSGNKCYGKNDAAIQIVVNSDPSLFNYILDNGELLTNNTIENISAGNHTVDIIDPMGCGIKTEFYIEPQTPINVEILSSTDANCAGKKDGSIAIQATGGQGTYQYNWSNGQNTASISGLDAGDYYLTVTDNYGCTSYFNNPVIAGQTEMELGRNNVFTPNGDGINDLWTIDNLELYPDNQLAIFNRWGNEVLTVKGYHNDWDGSQLNEGTYFYILKVKMCDEDRVFNGYITILR